MSVPVRSIGSVLERKKKENTIHHIGKTNTTNALTNQPKNISYCYKEINRKRNKNPFYSTEKARKKKKIRRRQGNEQGLSAETFCKW